jgi:hypothetical protein
MLPPCFSSSNYAAAIFRGVSSSRKSNTDGDDCQYCARPAGSLPLFHAAAKAGMRRGHMRGRKIEKQGGEGYNTDIE